VTLADFPAILASLPAEFNDGTIRGLRSAARRLEGYTVEEITSSGAVATGELARSASTHDVSDGAYVLVDAPHAAAVENGSRPHWAPLQPLIDWVITKRIASDPVEARGIAFAVQAAIARRGTRPRHYMRRAVARIQPEVVQHILAEWNKI
jgi:type IV secretory pathway protease TraF